ncbi:MAG: pantoate--beta-alanine ligase [Candidatus Cloacimonetes bacterium]|nr:pantoate--beta-alanine ligase [Candidatus Cloacimonadota bacterium]HOA30266.1 pantoate--beta-alanine ligase [Candidatus Cloacimonadota bacterium]
MKVINDLQAMRDLVYPPHASIGFVPTMGYLHEGHLSLVKASKQACDVTVVSIFVNPTQFGPNEDLSSYPRDIERDLHLLEAEGAEYVFFPTGEMMYPKGYRSWVEVDELSSILCGASRPSHFRGVCTVVLKLINIVRPHRMFMGEKDFQQLSILRKMAEDLNLRIDIIGCPIVREADGLAKSSRNVYLDPSQRITSLSLSQALQHARQMVAAGELSASSIIAKATELIANSGARVDYVSIVDARNLQAQESINDHSRMILAAYVGKTRLIDNMPLF